MISAIFIPAGPIAQPSFTYSVREEWSLQELYHACNCDMLQAISLGKLQYMYVDDNGRGKNLPFNAIASVLYHRLRGGDMIVGNAVILGGDQEGETVSVDKEVLFLVAKIATVLTDNTIGGFNELAELSDSVE